MLDDIIRITQKLRKDMESNIPLLDDEINYIIENQDRSSQKIERILDTLLDYLQLGIGEEQFKKLNSYYATFCAGFSMKYDKYYHELIDD